MTRRRVSTLSALSALSAPSAARSAVVAGVAALCALAALAAAGPNPQDAAGPAAPASSDQDEAKSPPPEQAESKPADEPTGDEPAGDEPASDTPASDEPASDGAGEAGTPASPHHRSLIGDRDCSECHTPDGWSLAGGASGGFDHAKTGFPLTGTHEFTSCIGCHGGDRKITRDCAGCHRDSHQGRLGQQCDQCHSPRTWHDTRAIERHRRTRLPLSGVHALLDCTSCHVRTAERTWSGVPAECFACHEDDYRSDIHPVHQGDPADPGLALFPRDCQRCHRPNGWTPAVINPRNLFSTAMALQALRDHDRHFPISYGKHRGADCESCHFSPASKKLVACTGCHVHSPATLRQRHGGASVAMDAPGCLRCHPGGRVR
ncbi:hypothetical protein [Haliangium sp.]|uniref:hypothetical protein n=1 Tax=Haliangium sp. TaxID=2663208 RepID=UPI003D0B9356